MKRIVVISILSAFLASSCVTKKIYNELEDKYANLKIENRKLSDNNGDLTKTKNQLDAELKNTKDELTRVTNERNQLLNELAAANNQLKTLQESYAALERNSDEALRSNMNKNRELLAQLDVKEKILAAEQERLTKLQNDLRERSLRIDELERMMASKEESMRRLKETLSKALNSFEGKGLTVFMKDGKVYVSMENKLLFQTGSWAVGAEGRRAILELGKVLALNPDISVLIEGHTDNVPFNGSGPVANNWDLSTKRATSIVNILIENKDINRQNLTAAGRGEYAPISSNDTAEGKAKNRRIEVILTPKLDEISKMLNEI